MNASQVASNLYFTNRHLSDEVGTTNDATPIVLITNEGRLFCRRREPTVTGVTIAHPGGICPVFQSGTGPFILTPQVKRKTQNYQHHEDETNQSPFR